MRFSRLGRNVRGLVGVSIAAAVLVGTPSAASAATPLPEDGHAILEWEKLDTYSVQTRHQRWSAVATVGSQGSDSDVALRDARGRRLAGSRTNGPGIIDWIAFDSNSGRLPTGAYTVPISRGAGNEHPGFVKYLAQFVQGQRTLATDQPTVEQPIGYPGERTNWLVDVRDLQLAKNSVVTLDVTNAVGEVHIVSSDRSDRHTWTRTKLSSTASVQIPEGAPRGTLRFRAPATGSYGVVFVARHWSGAATVRVSVS